ncbi:motility associated factor glycosyltransferase family protein [Solibacillus daqui]|uniref:motility associated factor glycosyltransferase family protein n=1 Tax=Solibacillus daqui TaxID=2912187 RepID=UPI0023660354|nr:6-hydroxymethylpterin diphosphokinase MptE-like protein [Solibacillus daqui]
MNIEIEQTKSGVMTMKVNNFYLHSKYNPLKEAKTFVEKNYKVGKTIILYGYGLGYIEDFYKKVRKLNEKIIVIDPFLKIDKINEMNVFYIDCEKVNHLSSYLENALTDTDSGLVEIIYSPNYRNIDKDKYDETMEIVSNSLKAKIINYNTIQSLAWVWYENFIDNLKFVMQDTTITEQFGKYSCPVVVVAGGPSLTKQLPLLKSIKGKCLILSAGSTIRTLLKHGIEPDFIVNVDGGEKNLEHFEQLEDSKINYLYGLQSTAKIRGKFSGECFYFSPMSEPLSNKFIKRYIPNIKKIEGGVSVATYTTAIAAYLSSGPIALIGQDLAYTNNQSHADGNAQQVIKYYEEDHFYKKITGYYGDEVFSDATLISMKDNLEKVLSTFSEKRNNFYNCTEGGAKINFIEQIPFATFIEKYIQENIPLIEGDFYKEESIDNYKNFLQKGIQLINTRELGVNKCIVSLENNNNRTDLLKSELNKCNKVIEELNLQGIVNQIQLKINKEFRPISHETIEEQIELFIRKNKFMFKELLEMLKKTREIFNQQLEKL